MVVPALNAAATLPAALDSLARQSIDWRAIVVDGGSTDDTAATARKFPRVDVIAAPGSSIYAALNIGVAASDAPTVALLNADDIFLADALAHLFDALQRSPAADVARGRPQFFADTSTAAAHAAEIESKADRPLSLRLITRGPVSINTMLFRREVFDRIGGFDQRWRFAADREWLLRLWLSKPHWIDLAEPVYRYRVHLGSSTLDREQAKNYSKIREEHLDIIARFDRTAHGDDTLRAELRVWHATEVALIARRAVGRREWAGVGRILFGGFCHDPLWPIRLVGDALAGAPDAHRASPPVASPSTRPSL